MPDELVLLPPPPAPRIRHTIVLDDPFPDPPMLAEHIPDASPAPQFADDGRLEDDWVPAEDARPPEEIEKATRWVVGRGGGRSVSKRGSQGQGRQFQRA